MRLAVRVAMAEELRLTDKQSKVLASEGSLEFERAAAVSLVALERTLAMGFEISN
jgi:hypothetical protein